jgi:hypothetical protein
MHSPNEPTGTEQPKTADDVLTSDEIISVIEQVHACYDYCAVWKDSTLKEERAEDTGGQAMRMPIKA